MTTLTSTANETWTGDSSRRILIVEAPAGCSRRRWLEDYLEKRAKDADTRTERGARTFCVSCDFDLGGPWGGVNDLFSALYLEIQSQRPDLIERHALELVYILPQLRRTVTVRNPNLTDLAPVHERTRNYPADRAFRNVHGLIDLLDSWKTKAAAEAEWVIACDSFDTAGAMSALFFKELMRRRGPKLNLHLVAGVGIGNGEKTRASFDAGVTAEVITLNLPDVASAKTEGSMASRLASELEERIGDDQLARQIHLPELIRLWQFAGRADRVLHHKYYGLELYNTLGLYEDAIHYGSGLLALSSEFAPGNDFLRWSILIKLLMSHIGLGDVHTCLKLVDDEGRALVERHPEWGIQLFYLLAIFHARFLKPRDLRKGEEYLERGLAVIETADIEEDDRHFQFVFNRNGLAMIRGFQKQHLEAIELCRSGIERLTKYLGETRHRLHRSVLFYNTAQVYAAIGSHQEALEYYGYAIALDPNYSEYYNERGNVLLQLGRLDEARSEYWKAIELSPPYFEVFTNLGQCYRRMGAMEDAIDAYTRALDLEPDHVLALLGRAKAHEELTHVQEAISDYTAALLHDPTLWEALASRGVMHYEMGNLDASLADFDRAIQLKPGHGDLYQNRATVLADLGRYSAAGRDLRTALSLNPSDEDKPIIQAKLNALEEAA